MSEPLTRDEREGIVSAQKKRREDLLATTRAGVTSAFDPRWKSLDDLERYEATVLAVEAERAVLREAIEVVLADDETGAGGWGPDITMVAILQDALDSITGVAS